MSLGQELLGLFDLTSDGCRVDRREADALDLRVIDLIDARRVVVHLSHAAVQVVGLTEGIVVRIDHVERDAAQVVRELLSLLEAHGEDLELRRVDLLLEDFHGLGVGFGLVGRILGSSEHRAHVVARNEQGGHAGDGGETSKSFHRNKVFED